MDDIVVSNHFAINEVNVLLFEYWLCVIAIMHIIFYMQMLTEDFLCENTFTTEKTVSAEISCSERPLKYNKCIIEIF
jgi:hypothetical protein